MIEFTTFSEGAHGALRAEINEQLEKGVDGIVLDLRGNGGGLLSEAVLVSSIFIEDGLITYTKGRTQPRRDFDAQGDAIDEEVPLVVLVDGGSASASEIVTGAHARPQAGDDRGHAHLRQGRLPGGAAALQRRRAGHHRGRVLPAQGREHPGEGRAAHGAGAGQPRHRSRRGAAQGAQHPGRPGRASERAGAGAPGTARLSDGRRASQARPVSSWPSRCSGRADRAWRSRAAADRRATSCWWAPASAAHACCGRSASRGWRATWSRR